MMRPPCGVWLLHQPERLLRAQEGAGQVDVDDRLPLLEAQVLERDRRRAHAGVVEQQVEPAEALLASSANSAFTDGRVADVGGHGEQPLAPPRRRRRWSRCSASARRPASATCQPAASRASAQARPMPLPAPVTRATLVGLLMVDAPCGEVRASRPRAALEAVGEGEVQRGVEDGRQQQRGRHREPARRAAAARAARATRLRRAARTPARRRTRSARRRANAPLLRQHRDACWRTATAPRPGRPSAPAPARARTAPTAAPARPKRSSTPGLQPRVGERARATSSASALPSASVCISASSAPPSTPSLSQMMTTLAGRVDQRRAGHRAQRRRGRGAAASTKARGVRHAVLQRVARARS